MLVQAMLEIKKNIPINIKLFHVNYNMHSKSKIMSDYCLDIAKKHNLEIHIKDCDSKEFKNTNIESQAREFRYNSLRKICIKNKINYALTAHHQDDQIETIYMAEKNKSSWVSKVGIREIFFLHNDDNIKVSLIRPMLNTSKENIIQYASKNKLTYFDDPTNNDLKFLRNKIRNEIKDKTNDLQFRDKYLTISKDNLLKLDKIRKQINEQFYQLIILLKTNDVCVLDKELLIKEDYDFIFLFFKKILRENFNFNKNLSSDYWQNLHNFINGSKLGNYFSLNDRIFFSKSQKHIYIYTNSDFLVKTKLNDFGNYLFRLGTISVCQSNQFIKFKNKEGICIPLKFKQNLEVDRWEHGDKCVTSKGKQINVSDIFINNKLSLFHKENYPLLKCLDKIIWIPYLFCAKIDRLDKSKQYIVLRWNLNL